MEWYNIQSHTRWLKGIKILERMYYEDPLIDATAKRRMKILLFFGTHWLEATKDAFDVSERSIYLWKKILKEGWWRIISLKNKSRTPHNTRKRQWDIRVIERIIQIREEYPNLWKEKISPLLIQYCGVNELSCPAVSTIWRLITDMWWLRKYVNKQRWRKDRRKNTVLRKPKELKIDRPGSVVSLDTVEIRWFGWERRYVVTLIDIYTRYSHAVVTTSHTAKTSMSILKDFQSKFPYKIQSILTDNGSEFMKEFSEYLRNDKITHYHTYPNSPKMNAHCERFNRTIREWVLNMNRYNLSNLEEANKKVRTFLIFYNTKRVHYAFKNKLTPLQKLCLYDTIDISSLTAI